MTEDTQTPEPAGDETPVETGELTEEQQMEQAVAQMRARAQNSQIYERIVVPNPEIRYGKLADVAPDLNFDAGAGQPEPDAISYRAGNRTYVFPLTEQNKKGLLERMNGPVKIPTHEEIKKLVTRT